MTRELKGMRQSLVSILVTLLIIHVLTSCAPVSSSDPKSIEDVVENVSELSGYAPGNLGLAIARDGKMAYISFNIGDSLLVVNLTSFTTIASIDVSSAGTMLFSGSAVLGPNCSKLYVANHETRNVMVVNTITNSIEKVLPVDPRWGDSISASQDGTVVYITSNGLYVVNSSDNSYYQILIPGIQFESVEPSVKYPSILYCLGMFFREGEAPQRACFTFNLSSYAVERSSILTSGALPIGPMRFTINANETTAYFGSYIEVEDKGVGNFNVFDLTSFQILFSTPIECGVSDFAIDERTGKIYIIGFWAGGGAPNTGYVREWDMATNTVTKEIFVSPSGDQRAIAIDPVDSRHLYMTEGDFNILREVEVSTGREIRRLKFNKEEVAPHGLIRGDNIGYIVAPGCRNIYRLNLSSGELIGSIPMPEGAGGNGGYYRDRLYLSGGRYIYTINPSDGSLVDTFDIGREMMTKLTFFNDRMAAIDYTPGTMIGKHLLLFDAKNMTVLKSIDLPSEPHGNAVIASPDSSKLYISRGYMPGPTVITIFNASTLDVITTIATPIKVVGATGFLECDFDETNRILYLCGSGGIYIIHMDTDELIGTIRVPVRCTSAAGVVLSPSKDKLLLVSVDAHTVCTYDLLNSCWTRVTSLKGYFPTDTDFSPDRRYLYTVNARSDSITMVDLASGDVVKVIELRVPTSMSVSLSSTTTNVGDSLTITGSVSGRIPPPKAPRITNAMVSIYYRPVGGGWIQLANVTTDTAGNYSCEWTPTQVGEYEVKASWAGDERYEGAESSVVTIIIKSGCIIATATYGSELSPEVQYLRGFRDQVVLPTFAGSQFMQLFNAWYYSFSPGVVSVIAENIMVKTAMKVVLYPLIGILHLSVATCSALGFSSEVGVVMAGLIASGLIGIVYLAPLLTSLLLAFRWLRSALTMNRLRLLAIPWFTSLAIILIGEVSYSPTIMMFATGMFVLTTLSLSTTIAALGITSLLKRLKG